MVVVARVLGISQKSNGNSNQIYTNSCKIQSWKITKNLIKIIVFFSYSLLVWSLVWYFGKQVSTNWKQTLFQSRYWLFDSFLDLDQLGVQSLNSVIFLLVTNTSMSNLFPVLNSFAPLIALYLKENKGGMYRIVNLYLAKFLSDVKKHFCITHCNLLCSIVFPIKWTIGS